MAFFVGLEVVQRRQIRKRRRRKYSSCSSSSDSEEEWVPGSEEIDGRIKRPRGMCSDYV